MNRSTFTYLLLASAMCAPAYADSVLDNAVGNDVSINTVIEVQATTEPVSDLDNQESANADDAITTQESAANEQPVEDVEVITANNNSDTDAQVASSEDISSTSEEIAAPVSADNKKLYETVDNQSVSDTALEDYRGAGLGDFTMTTIAKANNNALVTGNTNIGGVTGNNNINNGAISNNNGVTTVLMNSGNNVSLQNATVINVTVLPQ